MSSYTFQPSYRLSHPGYVTRATNTHRRCLFNIPNGGIGKNSDMSGKKLKNKYFFRINDVLKLEVLFLNPEISLDIFLIFLPHLHIKTGPIQSVQYPTVRYIHKFQLDVKFKE